jgi:hypothetical protein
MKRVVLGLTCVLLVAGALIADVQAPSSNNPTQEEAIAPQDAENEFPTKEQVLGSLSLPYSGVGRLILTSDGYLALDVGGDIGMFAMPIITEEEVEPVSMLGTLDVQYADGVLWVAIEDDEGAYFEAEYLVIDPPAEEGEPGFSPGDDEPKPDPSPLADCPKGKKCCYCKKGGYSDGCEAGAVCNPDEVPVCDCEACTATCTAKKKAMLLPLHAAGLE